MASNDAVFDQVDGHEQVVFGHDEDTGLRCIVAIHSTALGPALGGTRMQPYASEQAALTDVLRLSRAMTYKAACAGLDLGGGKAVIIGDPATDKSEPLLRAYGRIVASLGGRYVTACDIGTVPDDMATIGRETRWATGMPAEHGGSGDSGVLTAYGVLVGMRAVAEHLWGSTSLADRRVAVQGVGKVGRRLVEHLLEAGARVVAADVDEHAVAGLRDRRGVEVVAPDEILSVEADLLSPNALGGVLNADSIPKISAAAVCGGANNQLATPEDAERLSDHAILYAPDYVVNPGGMISVGDEMHPHGHDPDRARALTETVGDTLRAVLSSAEEDDITTEEAARRFAEQRIREVGGLRRFWLSDASA